MLPTIWFRNTWSWTDGAARPVLQASVGSRLAAVELLPAEGDRRHLYCDDQPELLFVENETNASRVWGVPNRSPFVKDGIHDLVVNGRDDAVNPARRGTKAAAHYAESIAPGASATWRLRLMDRPAVPAVRPPLAFYATIAPPDFPPTRDV